MSEVNKPLAGLTIVDLTRLLPGPLATRRLHELGARVVKIEDPGEGDGSRHMWRTAADVAADRPGLFWRLLNDGKQVLRLDLRAASGRDAVLALVREADALIEGFRPGVMARLGLGWETLRETNPRLVVCAITGYGQSGPYAQRAGHDVNYLATAGVLEQIADRDGAPVVPNFQIADLLGGTQAALSGLLAALVGAQRSGRGSFVDVSMTHEVWRHHVIVEAALAVTGRTPPPGRDLLSGGVACYGVYRCADGRWLAVGALELKFWRSLCKAIGRAQWGDTHWSLGERPGSAPALARRDELAALLASEPASHWLDLTDPADCCVCPVLRRDEAQALGWLASA